jgi:hypothetical protein
MRKTLIALAFVATLVAGCGSSAATDRPQASGVPASGTSTGPTQTAQGATNAPTLSAPKNLDACSLLTAAEAGAVLGKAVGPGAPPVPGAHSCLFSPPALALDAVEISITSVADFKPAQKSITGLTFTRVSGIGDDAYYVSIGAGYEVLNVRKGQNTFSTSIILKGASDTKLMDGEKSLALIILGRI